MSIDEEKVKEAVTHLQRAGGEMIAAARAVLDVAEEMLSDPEALLTAAAQLGQLATLAGRSLSPKAAGEGRTAEGRTGEDGPRSRPRVQHIRVSEPPAPGTP